MECQVVLHEAESPYHPMRCQPSSRELEELVGEADQCRYGAGEGAPRANEGHEDEWSGGGGELHSASRPTLQGEGSAKL